MFLNIKNNYLLILSLFLVFIGTGYITKYVEAQFNHWDIKPGDDLYNDILYSPSVENIDLNGQAIIDSFNIDAIIDPGGTYGIRVNSSSSTSTYAAWFDGNVEIHGGNLTLSGQIIQANATTSILNFPGFLDTPDAYQSNTPPPGNYKSDHAKRTTITVHNEKVEGTEILHDYPIFFAGRFDMLKHRDHGGHVSSTVGQDIAFGGTIDPSNTAAFYNHELIHYNSTTGDIAAWFRIPDLDYNTDTEVWLFYGADVTESYEDPDDVWKDYKAVYHMEDANDAKGAYNGSFNHTPVTDNDVFISTSSFPASTEYSQYFDGAADYMSVPYSSTFHENAGLSVSAWIKVDSWPTDPGAWSIISKDNFSTQRSYSLYHTHQYLFWTFDYSKGTPIVWTPLSNISEGEWHLITGVADKSNELIDLIIDGVSVASTTGLQKGNLSDSTEDFKVGGGNPILPDFTGYIDEVRVRAMTADGHAAAFDATMVNNYLDPNSFYTVDISDVGKILGVSTTAEAVDFETDNTIYTDLVRSLWSQNSIFIYFDTGNVTVGTGTPTGLLNIFSNSGSNAEINLTSGVNSPWAIYNDESSNDLRFWNTNQVSGLNNMIITTSSQVAIGKNTANNNLELEGNIYFSQGTSTETLEVFNYKSDGVAIYGEGFHGLYAFTYEVNNSPIVGEAVGAGGIGVLGEGKVGVYGRSSILNGAGIEGRGSGIYGGYFTNFNDSSGAGFYAINDNGFAGVYGENSRTDGGQGVYGEGLYGVHGISLSTGAGIRGVATTSINSAAAYFEGNVSIEKLAGASAAYLDLYDDTSAPLASDCDESDEYGRMMVETTNHLLYTCASTGWKSLELEVCGNGIVEGSEVCDDGDLVTEGCFNGIKEVGTFCNSSCTNEYTLNEACDPGAYSPDCNMLGSWWTGYSSSKGTAYCKNDCSESLPGCLGF